MDSAGWFWSPNRPYPAMQPMGRCHCCLGPNCLRRLAEATSAGKAGVPRPEPADDPPRTRSVPIPLGGGAVFGCSGSGGALDGLLVVRVLHRPGDADAMARAGGAAGPHLYLRLAIGRWL